jgi:hypothetical protein
MNREEKNILKLWAIVLLVGFTYGMVVGAVLIKLTGC